MLRYSENWINQHQESWQYPVPTSRLEYDCLVARDSHYARSAGLTLEEANPAWIREGLHQLIKALKAPESQRRKASLRYTVLDLNRIFRNNALVAQH